MMNNFKTLVMVALFTLGSTLGAFAAGNSEAVKSVTTEQKTYPRGEALISVEELKGKIDNKSQNLVILSAENGASFALGHIPGALLVDRAAYAAAPDTQKGVSGNILETNSFTEFAQNLGINTDTQLVIYDDDFDSTRLWWAFTYYGLKNVRILNGSFTTWKDAGFPQELLTQRSIAKGNFVATIALPKLRIDTDELASLLDSGKVQVWDLRDPEEFTGEVQKSGAVRAGRIPGAKLDTWTTFKTPENKAIWKSNDEITALLTHYGYDKDKDQIFYCQSGVRASQGIFALYLAGWPLEKLRNYDSSWIGWSRSDRPLLTGPEI